MRSKCTICGKIILQNRSAHLREAHGIDSAYKGAVRNYFIEVMQ